MAGTNIYGELIKAQMQNSAADLTTPATGMFYWNTGTSFPKWYTGALWKTAVDTDSAQVVTNKDIDGGVASNARRITLPSAAKATLDALTRKEATLVYATDTNKLYADDGATLVEVGSGSGGAGEVVATDANATLTDTTSTHITYTGFTASRDVTLPTTGISAGYIVTLENTTAHDMVVKASGGTALTVAGGSNHDATVRKGFVVLKALTSAPTTPAHWTVLQVEETYSTSSTFTFDGSGGTGPSVGILLSRVRSTVTARYRASDGLAATSGTNSTTFSQNTAFVTRFRPTTGTSGFPYNGVQNATRFVGNAYINTSGVTILERDGAGNFWTNSTANSGADTARTDAIYFTYNIQ